MNFIVLDKKCQQEVACLFSLVFSSSEGEREGKLIGELASALANRIDNSNIFCVGACQDETIVGAIFFSRLEFDEPVDVFMLAPVAVSTAHQRKGIGQELINFGLNELIHRSVSVVTTYGDPAFYSKVGFRHLSEDVIKAPLPLSMPEGWLGQSLSDKKIPSLKSRPMCVSEFDNAAYW